MALASAKIKEQQMKFKWIYSLLKAGHHPVQLSRALFLSKWQTDHNSSKMYIPWVSYCLLSKTSLFPDTLIIKMRMNYVGEERRNRFCLFSLTLAVPAPLPLPHLKLRLTQETLPPAQCRLASSQCVKKGWFSLLSSAQALLTSASFLYRAFFLSGKQ